MSFEDLLISWMLSCHRRTRSRFSVVAQADIGEMMNMVLFPFVRLGRLSSQIFRFQCFEDMFMRKRGNRVIANVNKALEV